MSCPKTIFADKSMKISSDTQLERNSENSAPTFVLEPFFMSLLSVTIYEYIGEDEGAWQLAICQADVMKKSNHFIVMINYYSFIIVRKCVQNLSLKLKNSKVSNLEIYSLFIFLNIYKQVSWRKAGMEQQL